MLNVDEEIFASKKPHDVANVSMKAEKCEWHLSELLSHSTFDMHLAQCDISSWLLMLSNSPFFPSIHFVLMLDFHDFSFTYGIVFRVHSFFQLITNSYIFRYYLSFFYSVFLQRYFFYYQILTKELRDAFIFYFSTKSHSLTFSGIWKKNRIFVSCSVRQIIRSIFFNFDHIKFVTT